MPIYNGNIKQKDLYYGGTKIKEAYYGSTKVYSSGPLYYCYHDSSGYWYILVSEEPKQYVYGKKTGDRYGAKANSSSELEINYFAVLKSYSESQIVTGSILGTTTYTSNRTTENDIYT